MLLGAQHRVHLSTVRGVVKKLVSSASNRILNLSWAARRGKRSNRARQPLRPQPEAGLAIFSAHSSFLRLTLDFTA